MSDCKPAPMLFQSSLKLTVECTTPLVEITLYCHLFSTFIYLTHNISDLSFVVNMVS